MRIWSDQTRADTQTIKKVRQLGCLTFCLPEKGYFLRAYFSESSATAKMMMPPLMMYCQ